MFQAERQAKRASDDKRREREEQRQADNTKASEAAAFEALSLARHLEAYAKDCADVVAEPTTSSGEDWTHARVTPTLKPYQAVNWSRLGAVATAQALDLAERHKLRLGWIIGDALEQQGDLKKKTGIYGAGAARLGLDAWETAVKLRQGANLPAFDFPDDGWNFVETLRYRADQADRDDAARAAEPPL
ncbi:MAG: hypothetical protein DCF29_09540 [Alphaproteobacteria bacterium]|nr:MAG: hypothetical protein DCF29_09540 [Alphaproteobacteria bacterium]